MLKVRISLMISLLIIGGLGFLFSSVKNKTVSSSINEVRLGAPIILATASKFTSENIEVGENIPYRTEIEYDIEKDACGRDEIIQEGRIGKRSKTYEILYYEGNEYSRELISMDIENPQTEIIKKGLKKVYTSMQTDSGTISYWCKLGEFSATAYDARCKGCSGNTALGMKAGFGVVAVDKTVIPLNSQLYITGYGKAVAGDTGGHIRGKRIDLGFDEIGSWWGRRTVEVYLL